MVMSDQPRQISYPHTDFPSIQSSHLASDARWFANRHDLLASLQFVRGGTIAEVGVALGDLSVFILG